MMRSVIISFICSLLLIGCVAYISTNTFNDALSKSQLQSITTMKTTNGSVRKFNCMASFGSGVMISPTVLITAYHVIEHSKCYEHRSGLPLTVVWKDKENDIALVEVDYPIGRKYRKINCDGYQTGQIYYSLGYPGSYTTLILTELTSTSAKIQAGEYKNMRILNGIIIRGMSGGPIIDGSGKIVGINSATNEYNTYGISRDLSDTALCN